LPSALYGAIDRLGGAAALRLHFALTAAALVLLGWLLTEPARHWLRRVAVLLPFLAIGIYGWSQRPYLIGFACLAIVLCAVEGRCKPQILLAVGWVWLNSHGSWPLGLLAVAVLWAGRRLDRRDSSRERAAGAYLAGGLVIGALNPYGPALWIFPMTALVRRDVFSLVKEWQPPTFDAPDQLAFLGLVATGILALRRNPSWRLTLTLTIFSIGALLSVRNIPIAAVVLVAPIASAMAGEGPEMPGLLRRAAPVIAATLVAVSAVTALRPPGFSEDAYPVDAFAWLASVDLPPSRATIVTQDFVGNWLELRLGENARAFIDDRFEVVPDQVIDDYLTMLRGRPSWRTAVDRYEPDAVVWDQSLPLSSLLESSACWDVPYRDDDFIVAVPAQRSC